MVSAEAAVWAKRIAGALLVCIVAAVLAPPPPPVQHRPNRIPVVFWHTFAGEWQPIYEGMADRFNASQSKYEVIPISVPDSAVSTKFLLSAAGGATPDLMLDWDPILGTFSDKGLIQPFDNVMTPEERRRFFAQTYPIVLKHSVYKGKIMALIDGLDLFALYYRLDHLREIGLDQNHLPTTLEGVVALGKRLDRYDSGHHLRRIGFLPQNFMNFAAAFGGSFNLNGHIVVDNPGNLKALQFEIAEEKQYGYDSVIRFTSSLAADAGPTIPLITGDYSIRFDGEWRVKQVAQYRPSTPYCVVPLPAPRGGFPDASISAPNFLVLPAAAKNPKGAWEFAKFVIGFLHPEEGGRNMGDMGWLPDDPLIARSNSYQAYLRRYPQYKTFVDLLTSPNLGIPPRGPLQAFAVDQISKAEDAALRGAKSPEAALKEADANIRQEEARQRRLGTLREGSTL